MAAIRLLLGFLPIFISLYLVDSSSPVPVLIWSKDSAVSPDKPLIAGHTLSVSDFQERFLSKVLNKPQTVVIFLQDRLSMDDFSHYGDAYSSGSHGNAFTNLKVAMETANSSVVLPSVDSLSQLENLVRESIKGKLITVSEDELKTFSAGSYQLDNKVTNVLIVHLHPVSSSPSGEVGETFRQNDGVIAEITKQISQLSPSYTFILTGSEPNEEIAQEHLAAEVSNLPHDRLRRDVSDDAKPIGEVVYLNDTNGILVKVHSSFYLYMSGLVLSTANKTTNFFNLTKTPNGTVNDFTNTTSGGNITFTLTFGKDDVTIRFDIARSKRDWKCNTMDFNWKDDMFSVPCGQDMQVPLKMSYHCHETVFKNANFTLKIKHFQVQPFGIKGGKFSYAYDCVGFFSIPILMGLLVTGMLLVILFIGIMAVFSITTMDRFDDPKGSLRSFGATTG